MAGATTPPALFTIPAAAEFLPEFVRAILAQEILPGFPDLADPLSLSAARIYVPTRRAAQALASEIARQYPAPAVLLPQILPLGALGEAGGDNPGR